ncbi:MAG: ATP-dependent sacrificial sulfur transferase LarE [Thermoguttaceae bacterium]
MPNLELPNRPNSMCPNKSIDNNAQRLLDWFAPHRRCVVAFSGGVDSAVVAAAAVRVLDRRAVAVTAVSATTPHHDRNTAAVVAAEIGIRHRIVETREMESADFVAGTEERCYHCKSIRFAEIVNYAASDETGAIVVDGSNADDKSDFRPGRRAVCELGLRSPLEELGLSKDAVRSIAREWTLSCADKPAEPCLATRLAYGIEITRERLAIVGAAEAFLFEFFVTHGVANARPLRVRLHQDNLARLELQPAAMEIVFAHRDEIAAELRKLGLTWVALDLEGFRSGSLNTPRIKNTKRKRVPNQSTKRKRVAE